MKKKLFSRLRVKFTLHLTLSSQPIYFGSISYDTTILSINTIYILNSICSLTEYINLTFGYKNKYVYFGHIFKATAIGYDLYLQNVEQVSVTSMGFIFHIIAYLVY